MRKVTMRMLKIEAANRKVTEKKNKKEKQFKTSAI